MPSYRIHFVVVYSIFVGNTLVTNTPKAAMSRERKKKIRRKGEEEEEEKRKKPVVHV